ncbi:LPXTG cell wall anchor domain-containing protein [Microbacterium enclense]|uniref:LPXTG cell wall anchor domain-containing protein n=1 Tax=Microbacterium enclense TaxID=993073 RepID=UPI003F7D7D10
MKLTVTKAGASVALAGALLLAAPAVAEAYVPTDPNTITFEITESGPVGAGGFQPGAQVTGTLVGKGIGPNNLATANLPVTAASITKTADASGVATINVILPENPSGSYTLAVSGARADGSTGTGGTAPAGTGGTSAGGTTDASGSLPATGMDANSLLGFWVGGGALVLAGATVAVVATARRNRSKA